MTCVSCGRDVPDGLFCTVCGAHQRVVVGGQPGRGRAGERYAAHPEESVLQPALLTTLLPHLDHDRVDEFRWALVAGLAALLVLYLAGLITAAILVAALLVPVLYVLYLYEVRTYRDAPARVFGTTLGLGVTVGAVVTLVGNALRSPVPAIATSPTGIDIDLAELAVIGLLIPIVQEVAKPLPALLLRRISSFGQTIDGLVFGVAAGLGFALAQTIVQFAAIFTSLGIHADPGTWIFPLLTFGVFLPALHGSSTGIITAAVWRGRAGFGGLQLVGVGVALAAHVAFIAGSQVIGAVSASQIVVLAWQALVVGALLVWLRYQLHLALIDEALAFDMRRVRCPNCGEESTASGFCPACGMALAAATVRVGAGTPRQEPAQRRGASR